MSLAPVSSKTDVMVSSYGHVWFCTPQKVPIYWTCQNVRFPLPIPLPPPTPARTDKKKKSKFTSWDVFLGRLFIASMTSQRNAKKGLWLERHS